MSHIKYHMPRLLTKHFYLYSLYDHILLYSYRIAKDYLHMKTT